jgi:hypothetical protein
VNVLNYDPGRMPDKPAPLAGEFISIEVDGFPPYKDGHFSIRNPRHRDYRRFAALRRAATEAMGGRAWYRGPIGFSIVVAAPELEKGKAAIDYEAGIFDTLDGSHGPSFTYLPVVYEDDCQVVKSTVRIRRGDITSYRVRADFLPDE